MSEEAGHEQHEPAVTQVQEQLLGGPIAYTREQVAKDAGVPLEAARVLWRSMGYADVGEARAFTDADVAALHRMLHLIEVGHLDEDTASRTSLDVSGSAEGRSEGYAEQDAAEDLAAILNR